MKKASLSFVVRLLTTALFVGSSAGMLFAADSPGEEHAGYQGIPVRNSLNRGLIERENMFAAQRYPSLPRRKNEADLSPPVAVNAENQYDRPDRAGYAGIPQHTTDLPKDNQPTVAPETASKEHAGYGGIPQMRTTGGPMKRSNSFSKRTSALVKAK